MTEAKGVTKQLISERVHVKIVGVWDTKENSVLKDQEKYRRSSTKKILQLMMLFKICNLIGNLREIDGMDMNLKCIRRLLNNFKSLSKFGRRKDWRRVMMMLINNLGKIWMHWSYRSFQRNLRKIRSFKDLME